MCRWRCRCERWFNVQFHYLNKIFSAHLERKTSHVDAMTWQGGARDTNWWSGYTRRQYKYDGWKFRNPHASILELRQVCPVLHQCALIHEELPTLWGGSPVSSLRKPRIPDPLPWINFFTSAGKHLDVSTNAHSGLWALIILHYLNSKFRHFQMVKHAKVAFLSSEFTLPASHDLSVSLQSFLSCFFGEKLNKSFPRVPSFVVCDNGDAVFHDVQIWKIKEKKSFSISYC